MNMILVVAGAGIAGISAAVKAGSLGASVLLIEHYPFLGGMSSAGMVSPFMKSITGDKDLVQGFTKMWKRACAIWVA
jgi:flavin-dependent dehydrogenase